MTSSAARSRPVQRPRQRDLLWVRRLVWLYFFLLIFEGALRKWVVPGAANALLVVRDPVVLAAYFLALRGGLFPRNLFVTIAGVLGVATLTAGLLVNQESPAIALYGFRTNFLQLPFIFLIAKVFDARDVERAGFWFLLGAMPMAALMVLQFLAPPSSFINAGSEEQFAQIASAMGRIRPPGTFSFIVGPVFFFTMVTAFLLHTQFRKRYSNWLVLGATLATLCAAAVSGSRSLVAGIAVVFAVGLACSGVTRPLLALRWLGALAILAVAAFFLSNLPFFQFGLTVFTSRVSGASQIEGGALGFLARVFSGYTDFIPHLFDAPLWGRGLGLGTLVGAALVKDRSLVIWFENEWTRHILESGPLLGGAFIVYRVALTAWMGGVAVRHAARHDPLPVLLLGTFFLTLINGIIGQPTVLGFLIFGGGLCLASMRAPQTRPRPALATQDETPAERMEALA